MKKIRTSILAIMALWLFAVPGFGYTVHFAVDNTLTLGGIDAIDVYTDSELVNWTVTPGGAVPTGWIVEQGFGDFAAGFGWNAAAATRDPGAADLNQGVVLSIAATDPSTPFEISFINLQQSSGGFLVPYDGVYSIIPSVNTAGEPVYTASAVPIPAAAWLLGSGVVGLVALKRRKKNG